MVRIPHPESVERYVNYKHSTAIKTVRLQPQLNLVHIPDTEYTQLPSLQLPSQESKNTLFVPHHRYNLRNFPSRRLITDTSTLNLSALSSNSASGLARQHDQPLSDTHTSKLVPQSYLTSGLDTASILSSDAQSSLLSGHLFSEVIIRTPVPAHIRLPECYTASQSF